MFASGAELAFLGDRSQKFAAQERTIRKTRRAPLPFRREPRRVAPGQLHQRRLFASYRITGFGSESGRASGTYTPESISQERASILIFTRYCSNHGVVVAVSDNDFVQAQR